MQQSILIFAGSVKVEKGQIGWPLTTNAWSAFLIVFCLIDQFQPKFRFTRNMFSDNAEIDSDFVFF